MAKRADDGVASGDRALHGVGARGVAEDERDAVVDLAGLRLLADERRDLVAGRERLRDELAADAAGRSEDCEPRRDGSSCCCASVGNGFISNLLCRRVGRSVRPADAKRVPTTGLPDAKRRSRRRASPARSSLRDSSVQAHPSMSELLEIRLLGPFEVLAGGTPADVGGSKRQALLAMLALRQGRVVDVDGLVDGLWGEELPAAPRNALHHHIARLRAALGEESIVGSADGYALKGARVDAVRFEELLAETRAALRDGDVPAAADAVASALALWRGSALQGLTGTAWFSAEARRLETLHVDALEEDFEVRLALGEHRELAPALRSALADNPFRERLWGQLMLALYRSGRQADALETFQEARRVLADELGLEPGPELRRLQEAILAHDPAIAAVPVVRRRRGNLPAPSTSFVGREDELGQVSGSCTSTAS